MNLETDLDPGAQHSVCGFEILMGKSSPNTKSQRIKSLITRKFPKIPAM